MSGRRPRQYKAIVTSISQAVSRNTTTPLKMPSLESFLLQYIHPSSIRTQLTPYFSPTASRSRLKDTLDDRFTTRIPLPSTCLDQSRRCGKGMLASMHNPLALLYHILQTSHQNTKPKSMRTCATSTSWKVSTTSTATIKPQSKTESSFSTSGTRSSSGFSFYFWLVASSLVSQKRSRTTNQPCVRRDRSPKPSTLNQWPP